MPIYSRPTPPDLAKKVALALSVFGTDKKSAVMEYVSEHPRCYSAQIEKNVRDEKGRPIASSTLTRLLRELVAAGLLVHDVAGKDSLRGMNPRYSVNQEKVSDVLAAVVEKMQRLRDQSSR